MRPNWASIRTKSASSADRRAAISCCSPRMLRMIRNSKGWAVTTASVRVQAVVDIYGLSRLGGPSRGFQLRRVRAMGPLEQFMGGKTPDDAPELYEKASPITHLTKDAPPTLILHGTIDDVVNISQSDRLAAKLSELGVPYLYDRIEGWHHGMDVVKEVNAHCEWMMDQFFAQVLPLPAQ